MAWFADLAGKAEDILNNIDEQTGAALRVVSKNSKDSNKLQQKKGINGRKNINAGKAPAHSNDTIGLKETSKTKATPKNFPPPPITQTRRSLEKTNPKTRTPNQSPLKIPSHETGNPARGDCKRRRNTIPGESRIQESLLYKQQTLEVENAMLNNELNVLNKEVSEFLARLRQTEDELKKTSTELNITKATNEQLISENVSLKSKLDQYLERSSQPLADLEQMKTVCETLQNELDDAITGKQLEVKKLEKAKQASEASALKLERELRQAHKRCEDLTADAKAARTESAALQAEWEAYRLRVKGTLASKDAEIRALQEGGAVSGAVAELQAQVEELRRERAGLSAAAVRMRTQHESTEALVQQLQTRAGAADRLAVALREALTGEKAQRHHFEAECRKLNKELSALRQESSETAAGLRAALRSAPSPPLPPPPPPPALNVASYERRAEAERAAQLTGLLVARQARLDALAKDNNTLRIQLEMLEEKLRKESQTKQQSNIPLHEVAEPPKARRRPARAVDLLCAAVLRRHPLVRLFMIVYIVGLHLWVFTVIFSNTPSDGVLQMRA